MEDSGPVTAHPGICPVFRTTCRKCRRIPIPDPPRPPETSLACTAPISEFGQLSTASLDARLPAYAVKACRSWPTAQARSSWEMINGGARRMTWSCVSLHSRPRSFSRSQ